MDCVGDIAKHFLLFMSFEMTGKGINNLNRLFFFFGLILKRINPFDNAIQISRIDKFVICMK